MLKFAAYFAATVLGTVAVAQAQDARYNVTIPFAFNADSERLPAGDYALVIDAAYRVSLIEKGGTQVFLKFGVPSGNQVRSDNPSIVFNQYGDRFFLHQLKNVRGGDMKWLPGRTERELARTTPPAVATITVGGTE